AAVVEFDEITAEAGDVPLAFEFLDVVSLWPKPASITKRSAEIPDDVPGVDAAVPLNLIDLVVRLLEIPAVKRQQDYQETVVRLRAFHERVIPGPRADVAQRRVVEPEASAAFGVNARSILHLERRQEVHRRLVIPECGQHARDHHLRRAFGSSSAFGALL